jgi:hypothetical protein
MALAWARVLRVFACATALSFLLPIPSKCSLQSLPRLTGFQPLKQSEKQLSVAAWHVSDFSPDGDPRVGKCRVARLPEPLMTPDPRLPLPDDLVEVRVSIIIGPDGRVQSPFVLDGAGPFEADIILHAVHSWRYRPALCNGVPIDSEAVIRFIVP